MEFFHLTALFSLVVFTSLCIKIIFSRDADEPPQPRCALPVLGHLHLLSGRKPMFQLLGDMADAHGPVLKLRLGLRPTVLVSSWEAAKECFTINDKALSSRPRDATGKYLGYNYAMFGFAPYGSYWRSLRRIAMSELLSNAHLEKRSRIRAAEIDTCVKELYALWVGNGRKPVKLDVKKWFGDMNYNIVVRLVAGKRYFGSGGGSDKTWRFRKATSEFFRLVVLVAPSDMFPFLEWLDFGGHLSAMKSAAQEMDAVMKGLVEEHRLKRISSKDDESERDFMDAMIRNMEEDAELSEVERETAIKTTSLGLILGGADTTTISLTWALALLLNHRDALKRAQAELDAQVGTHRLVDDPDIKNLTYLQAVIKESFRLCPTAPLLVPRESTEDCRIGGFRVRAGTRVVVNAWKLQRDPSVWEEPNEFRPERFLPPSRHAGVDVRGQDFELLPFGAGRRSCPGTSFALQVMHLALARLLQGFELETPRGEAVDMSEALGKTVAGAIPLELLLAPRLPERLYGL